MTRELDHLVGGKEPLLSGHRLCAGCTLPTSVRQILMAAPEPQHLVVILATGCFEVSTTVFPFNAWRIPVLHLSFETAAAAASGVEAAYRALRKKGKIEKEIRFVVIAGDGGTHDIGLQSLSGMLERGHRILYVENNNEAYQNTGTQSSSATPAGAHTTTTPRGGLRASGARRKDIMSIVAAHHVPYAAQVAVNSLWPLHLTERAAKAFAVEGPSFLHVLAPCPRGWGFASETGHENANLAIETGYWPLYEIEDGVRKLNYVPTPRTPLATWLATQDRFRDVLKDSNAIGRMQADLDREWEILLASSIYTG